MSSQPSLYFYDLPVTAEESVGIVVSGLQKPLKTISPKYFYDSTGSSLFMEITRQPEYYPTRTEIGLLRRHAGAMSKLIGEDCLLIEYGSGSSEKIRILLESLKPKAYAPLDISRNYLAEAAAALAGEFPWLEVHATCLDYTKEFELPFSFDARKVAFFPGSSIGNFSRLEARDFLGRVRELVGSEGGMLIGVDLKKDTEILNAAYNDAEGVTERFNLNILSHLNAHFGANFDIDGFAHFAEYEAHNSCVAMYLISLVDQEVQLADTRITLAAGEKIHTENSHKYSKQEFLEMANDAGFSHHQCWSDANDWFGVFYLH